MDAMVRMDFTGFLLSRDDFDISGSLLLFVLDKAPPLHFSNWICTRSFFCKNDGGRFNFLLCLTALLGSKIDDDNDALAGHSSMLPIVSSSSCCLVALRSVMVSLFAVATAVIVYTSSSI
eukprot:scaffold1569_cov143-Skeletonema_menzelii.AAC.6